MTDYSRTSRRLRLFAFGPDTLTCLFSQLQVGRQVRLQGWPAGAKVISFREDYRFNSLVALVECEEFEPVEEGQEIPSEPGRFQIEIGDPLPELPSRLRAYLDGKTTLREFRDWFHPATWGLSSVDPAANLAWQIDLRIAEFTDHTCTEAQLKSDLRDHLWQAER